MRQAELSSMHVAPALTAAGISSRETSVVAEKNARSMPWNDLGVASSTSIAHSPTVNFRPTERWEASRRSPLMGKRRCAAILRNSWPTSPVAPTTATLYADTLSCPGVQSCRRYGSRLPRPPSTAVSSRRSAFGPLVMLVGKENSYAKLLSTYWYLCG